MEAMERREGLVFREPPDLQVSPDQEGSQVLMAAQDHSDLKE